MCDHRVIPDHDVVPDRCTSSGSAMDACSALPQGRDGLSARRMAVLCTFREPSLCRPVHRELLRNAVLNLTLIIPATACHQRDYIERYSRFTRRSPRGGSGCQGCAAERSTTGATEERKEPGLDAGASEAYIASPSSRKNRSGQPQARGAAPELRPPARPPRPWEAFHGVPIRGTQPGS